MSVEALETIQPTEDQLKESFIKFYESLYDPADPISATIPDGQFLELLGFDKEHNPIPEEDWANAILCLAETGQYPQSILKDLAQSFWQQVLERDEQSETRRRYIRFAKVATIGITTANAIFNNGECNPLAIPSTVVVWNLIDQATEDPIERKVASVIFHIEVFQRMFVRPDERKNFPAPRFITERGYEEIWNELSPRINYLLDIGANIYEIYSLVGKSRLHHIEGLKTGKKRKRDARISFIESLDELIAGYEIYFQSIWSSSDERMSQMKTAEIEQIEALYEARKRAVRRILSEVVS